jgi:hypothetical protein
VKRENNWIQRLVLSSAGRKTGNKSSAITSSMFWGLENIDKILHPIT